MTLARTAPHYTADKHTPSLTQQLLCGNRVLGSLEAGSVGWVWLYVMGVAVCDGCGCGGCGRGDMG